MYIILFLIFNENFFFQNLQINIKVENKIYKDYYNMNVFISHNIFYIQLIIL